MMVEHGTKRNVHDDTKGDGDKMTKRPWIVWGGVLAALAVAALVGTQAVYADTATPPAPPDERGLPGDAALGERPAGPHGPPGLGPAALEAAASALGMTTDKLSTALQDGKTLEDLAAAQGVDFQTVQDAIKAAHQAQMLEDISHAVADGNMTQDKADWLILGLENGYMDGPGFGFGGPRGPGGPHGQPGVAPQATQQAAN
jgi:hypothetical protein